MQSVKKRSWKVILASSVAGLVGLALIFIGIVASRPLPQIEPALTYVPPEKPVLVAWPEQGASAIGSLAEGVKGVAGGDEARPIASMAKVITALVILDKKPLVGDGETVTLDQTDVDFFAQTIAKNGSNLMVQNGEQLTERQLLEALLLVSANNIADSLVHRIFGSQENYKIAAEAWLAKNNLENTTVGSDGSGLDPATTSSPSDMIKIGQLALQNPTVAEIVAEKTITLPLEGEVKNTNKLLDNGYVGIKTGNSDQAGSCLLFAKEYNNETIIGVLLDQPFGSTFDTARGIVSDLEALSAKSDPGRIPAGTKVGEYRTAWGDVVDVVTAEEVAPRTRLDARPRILLAPVIPSQSYAPGTIGELTIGRQKIGIKLSGTFSQPTLLWRLTHLDQLQW
jgi:D-alanyl-D-alanine carboxypeptidase (penicillin-binding protein 5/6)